MLTTWRNTVGFLSILYLAACGSGANQSPDSTSINDLQDAAPGTVEIVSDTGDALTSGHASDASSKANLEVADDSFDFGTLTEGEVVEHTFTFTNTGGEPLILSQVSASCGCTTPDFSKTPIVPGGEGEVKVRFDSSGQVGRQHKVISVANNGVNNIVLLHLRGEVKPK